MMLFTEEKGPTMDDAIAHVAFMSLPMLPAHINETRAPYIAASVLLLRQPRCRARRHAIMALIKAMDAAVALVASR